MPWYVLWALPLAALLPTSRWARAWLPALSLAALWSALAADVLGVLLVPRLAPTTVSYISVGVLYLPLLLVSLWTIWRNTRISWELGDRVTG
jgi:hypothetical protein